MRPRPTHADTETLPHTLNTLACADISKLIPRPGHGDMLRAWVYYEAKRSLNQKKCLSLVLFSLKTAF